MAGYNNTHFVWFVFCYFPHYEACMNMFRVKMRSDRLRVRLSSSSSSSSRYTIGNKILSVTKKVTPTCPRGYGLMDRALAFNICGIGLNPEKFIRHCWVLLMVSHLLGGKKQRVTHLVSFWFPCKNKNKSLPHLPMAKLSAWERNNEEVTEASIKFQRAGRGPGTVWHRGSILASQPAARNSIFGPRMFLKIFVRDLSTAMLRTVDRSLIMSLKPV